MDAQHIRTRPGTKQTLAQNLLKRGGLEILVGFYVVKHITITCTCPRKLTAALQGADLAVQEFCSDRPAISSASTCTNILTQETFEHLSRCACLRGACGGQGPGRPGRARGARGGPGRPGEARGGLGRPGGPGGRLEGPHALEGGIIVHLRQR